MRLGLTFLTVLLASACVTRLGSAAPLPVTNPGFETDVLADGAANSTIAGWTIVSAPDPEGTFNPDVANPPLPTEGANVVYMAVSFKRSSPAWTRTLFIPSHSTSAIGKA